MRIVLKEPSMPARVMVVPNELRMLQQLVGGYIEVVQVTEHIAILCNEEGKLFRLDPNLEYNGDQLVGTVLFVGTKGDEFVSLSETDAKLLASKYRGC